MNKDYWIYILLCENNAYYTGYTVDLTKRYRAHLNGTASKYTRSFRPLKIAQSWKVANKSLAMQLENGIKKMSRENKEKIIERPALLFDLFRRQYSF